ncbi:uncharacterized protein EV420DRAFT_1648643 [Desarmillaria tabescens]|uniref:Uncharacterized protein n=1 Tax=Armillaria tabescens TaxID=1929756 RepID=A0AA39JLW9_ARMTA|nr:uncharacterized protein EV420DRAFT_1648643 [Desarmillaria tabescens]KAK0444929.1 hypothetical protein EV420DRAFT_1648643 [Desarmillaria tabescens]
MDDMRLHLEEHMNDDLAKAYLKANHKGELANLKDIDKWIEKVHLLDKDIHKEASCGKHLFKVLLAENTTQTSGNATSVNKVARMTHAQTMASSNPDLSTATSDTKLSSNPKGCPPCLTDAEKELLIKHLGCFVCRQFYTDHIGSSCKTGNPDPTTYKTLTEANALAVKAMYEAQKKTFIAGMHAHQGESSALSDDENMIGDSSDASAGNEYIDPSKISSPALSSAVPVQVLIDHSSPTVLISAKFAIRLALKQRKLTRLIPFSSILDSSTAQTLNKCVRFRISKNSWTSHRIFAMICPTLHCDIILGTPFLYCNNVIIDHGSHSAFAAGSDINLLDSRHPLKTSMVPFMSPQEAHLTAVEERKHANKEVLAIRKALQVTCAPLLHELESLFVSSGLHERMHPFTSECDLPCRVAALHTRISSLAEEEKLSSLDTKAKTRFADRFPTELPHVTELPMTVYHWILMCPHTKISVSRPYSCPWKYHEAWKTLIDQHEQAGRIQPSSSEYALPSFIILKADPTVLPRWVNDFCLINAAMIPDNYLMFLISDILTDCGKGRYWGKIDMMNSFF